MMRPVFVPKEDRITLNEELQREKEVQEAMVQREKAKELKRRQTKEIVKKYIEEDDIKENAEKAELEESHMPDDTDYLDDLNEYENWKLRELRRIKTQFEEDSEKLKNKLIL